MTITIKRASEVKKEVIEGAFGHRLIRGALVVGAGPGESGKGHIQADLAARFTTGAPFPDTPTEWREPGHVFVCTTEDGEGYVRGRLEAAGANLEMIHFVSGPEVSVGGVLMPSPMAVENDAGELVEQAKDLSIRALFMETMVEHLGSRERGHRFDSNNEVQVRQALSPIRAICRAANLFGFGVMHPRKSAEGGVEDSLSGSAAFRNLGRGVLHVYRDPLEPTSEWRLLFNSKSNMTRHRPKTLRFRIDPWEHDPNYGRVVWGIAGRTLEDERDCDEIWQQWADRHKEKIRRDHSVMNAEDLLKEYLGVAPRPPEEMHSLAQAAGISRRSLERAKEALGVESIKAGFPARVVVWRLPEGGEAQIRDMRAASC